MIYWWVTLATPSEAWQGSPTPALVLYHTSPLDINPLTMVYSRGWGQGLPYLNTNMDMQDLKRRAGITEQVERTDDELISGLGQAHQQLAANRPDAARYYVEQVMRALQARRQ